MHTATWLALGNNMWVKDPKTWRIYHILPPDVRKVENSKFKISEREDKNQSPHPLFIRYSFIEYTVYARLCVCVCISLCLQKSLDNLLGFWSYKLYIQSPEILGQSYTAEPDNDSRIEQKLVPHGLQPTMLLHPWDSPGKSTGVGRHALLQGVFLRQGWNPHLLPLLLCQADSLLLDNRHTTRPTKPDFILSSLFSILNLYFLSNLILAYVIKVLFFLQSQGWVI